MALWLVRGGKYGEHEAHFLSTGRIYATWNELRHDLGALPDKGALREVLQEQHQEWSKQRTINYSGQLWSFAHEMQPKDWVVMPLKNKPAIAVAELKGEYQYDAAAENPYFHSRTVKWLATDVPRSVFDQDLLYSLGAFMTICEITRNDAEKRVRALAKAGWADGGSYVGTVPSVTREDEDADAVDLEQLARDQIAKLLIAKYKGHGMTRLVEALLRAQGYTTYLSPEGPDKGVDILAAPGPLGFGRPRICVQVKSGEAPIDHPTLSQLVGTMQSVHADQGLLVAWGGFKSSVDKERAQHFFRVRFWDQQDLIAELLEHYSKLDEDLKAELPLKRVWVVARSEEEA